jgi:hypothetical protein
MSHFRLTESQILFLAFLAELFVLCFKIGNDFKTSKFLYIC